MKNKKSQKSLYDKLHFSAKNSAIAELQIFNWNDVNLNIT